MGEMGADVTFILRQCELENSFPLKFSLLMDPEGLAGV